MYNLELIFNELPNTRRISIIPDGASSVLIKMNEIPDQSFIDALLSNDGTDRMMELFEKNLGKSFVKGKLKEQFCPEIRGYLRGDGEAAKALERENERAEGKINSSRIIRSLVMRITNESEDGEESGIAKRFSAFLSKMMKGGNS